MSFMIPCPLQFGDRAVDRPDEAAGTVHARDQLGAVRLQRRQPVRAAVEQLPDRVERHAQLAVEEDVLQAQQLLAAVVTVPVPADERRLEQADRVIMMQRAHRHAGEARELLDGVPVHAFVLPQDDSIVPHAA
ncbi:MAG: hypothetical protein WDN24_03160 [Sphingomonas sp.]